MRKEQVVSKVITANYVSEDPQSTPHHRTRQNGQTIQAVRQIDGVTCANNHDVGQNNKTHNPQRISEMFKERNNQIRLRRHC